MARHIELNPVSFLTIGVVGEPGQRTFYIQGSRGTETISLILEKEQAATLAVNFESLLEELAEKHPPITTEQEDTLWRDMRLKEPVEPLFRVGNIGLGYNEETDQVVLVAYELTAEDEDPNVVSYWATQQQIKVLAAHTNSIVTKGRFFDPGVQFVPKQNGHVS